MLLLGRFFRTLCSAPNPIHPLFDALPWLEPCKPEPDAHGNTAGGQHEDPGVCRIGLQEIKDRSQRRRGEERNPRVKEPFANHEHPPSG